MEEGYKYHYKRAIIDLPAKRHLNGVLLACRCWPTIECWLDSCDFSGDPNQYCKETIFFVIFQGDHDPLFPPPLDPHMQDSLNTCIAWSVFFSCLLSGKLYCLTLNAPIATKVVCFSRLVKCLRSLYCNQSGPRSDWSYRKQSVLGLRCLLLYLIRQ